jgi:hypothetical protein
MFLSCNKKSIASAPKKAYFSLRYICFFTIFLLFRRIFVFFLFSIIENGKKREKEKVNKKEMMKE